MGRSINGLCEVSFSEFVSCLSVVMMSTYINEGQGLMLTNQDKCQGQLLTNQDKCQGQLLTNRDKCQVPDVILFRWEELGPFVLIFTFVVLSGLAKIIFHHFHVLSSRVPESW